jgi:hypothetical protein
MTFPRFSSHLSHVSRYAFAATALLWALGTGGCKPKPGDSCSSDGEAKCMDPKAALLCHGKKWTRMDCRGAKGCALTGALVDCDESAAEEKDFCDHEGNYSCSVDKKSQLKCEKNGWKVDTKCLGPKGCSATSTMVDCDDSVAAAGDPCAKDDHHTCALDKTAVLVCKSGKFAVASACKGATCKVEGSTVGCD